MSIPLTAETLCGGAMIEALEIEIQKILDNIADPNTEAKKAREVILKIQVKPNEQRNMADVVVKTEAKLAPSAPIETSIIVERKGNKVLGAELWSGETPGQATLPGIDMHKVTPLRKEGTNA